MDGSIYVGAYKHPIGEKSLFVSPIREPCHLKSVGLASSYIGTKYFAHWLADDCTKYLLAEELSVPLCLRRPAFAHQKKYETYFSQNWTPVDRARIDNLIVFQDFSQNSSKRERYRILRDRITKYFPESGRQSFVYLKRGRTGASRMIGNEDELLDAFIKRDFIVLDVASDSLDQIIGTLVNAKIVVSMEGSHAAHCVIASPEKSGFLVLQPPDRFCGVFNRGWTGCLNVKFGFVVGAVGDAGYFFAISEVLRTIDLMLSNMEALRAV